MQWYMWGVCLCVLLVTINFVLRYRRGVTMANTEETTAVAAMIHTPGGQGAENNSSRTGRAATPRIKIPPKTSPARMIEQMLASSSRVVPLRLLDELACPYAAAYLTELSLHLKLRHWSEVWKMEEVFFNTLGNSRFKFQFQEPELFYVHHLSEFEHVMHTKHGFDKATLAVEALTAAAVVGECAGLDDTGDRRVIALVPFFSGLPPNVTAGLRVESVGEGNSLMSADVKLRQLKATLCSVLRRFGQVVIGVANKEDRLLVLSMLKAAGKVLFRHTHVVQFRLGRPSLLPPHLLTWSQTHIQQYNCRSSFGGAANDDGVNHACDKVSEPRPHGPMPVTTHVQIKKVQYAERIEFVFYTESDQLLRVTDEALALIAAATNASCLFVPRRSIKDVGSEARDYMGGLDQGNSCGVPDKYFIDWPRSSHVLG